MTVASPNASTDALTRLRIPRGESAPRRSFLGRLIRFLFVMVVVVVLLAGGTFLAQARGWLPNMDRLLESVRPKPEVRVSIVSVETGRSADAKVVSTGYLKSRQQARIGARATGRIEQLNVEEGSKVKAHDVLAVLEHAELDASLAAVKAMAARARSELLEQDVEIRRTKKVLDRAQKSLAAKTIAAAEFDAAEAAHDAAVARKASLEAALQLAEARVEEAEQLLENMFVRAPFAGTVISKDAELGESIMPGGMGEASGRGSVVTIADLDHLEVECDVKEDFISGVTEGQQAEVAVDAVPDRRYQGKVRKIIPMGDRARATVKVLVEILDADERLFPDMSSTVYFLSAATEGQNQNEKPRIFCPNDALHTAGSERFVWIVTSDDRLQRVIVEVGEEKEDRSEILKGLSGGENVVVSPPKEFNEGMLVRTAQ
ncbi:MAG: efflux RND transporter periplasmic adaptor subunit [Fuerstia sp.]|nr:efflux RND transporter periplasmic adaptor subunit [Fuerstiella sp.]